jgi:branched-chain amino acid transport system substrate-binding protein
MAVNRKKLGALLLVLAATAMVVGTAAASHTSTPGVTSSKVTIGGTFPLTEGPATGGASLYKTIAFAEQAYYLYVNKKYGGVFHRKINDIVLDDQYTPSETVQQTTKLVEQDHIFADVGSLGTAPALSVWGYLNKHKVPQVLLATGDAYWGNCVHKACDNTGVKKSWTEGWQPDYPGEAKLYAKYILKHKPSAKIGVLYQADAFGRNYLAGLRNGLGKHKKMIVATQSYNTTDSPNVAGAHVIPLRAAGADTLVIFATPGAAIGALATTTGIQWSPLTLLGNVSANRIFMLKAAQSGASLNGVISSAYVASQTAQPNLHGMKLAKNIIHTYAPGLDQQFAIGDANLVYGLAVAWTFVDALKHAGKHPTRASLMHAFRNLHETGKNKNPFIYPGMRVTTSKKKNFPMEQLIMEKWQNGGSGDWKTFGKIVGGLH